jgi:hypothetical protein
MAPVSPVTRARWLCRLSSAAFADGQTVEPTWVVINLERVCSVVFALGVRPEVQLRARGAVVAEVDFVGLDEVAAREIFHLVGRRADRRVLPRAECGLALDRAEPIAAIAETHVSGSIDRLEGVEDPLLREQSLDKGKIGFAVLHAVDPWRQRVGQRPLLPVLGDACFDEHFRDDRLGVELLEDAAIRAFRQRPEGRADDDRQAVFVALGRLCTRLDDATGEAPLDVIPRGGARGEREEPGLVKQLFGHRCVGIVAIFEAAVPRERERERAEVVDRLDELVREHIVVDAFTREGRVEKAVVSLEVGGHASFRVAPRRMMRGASSAIFEPFMTIGPPPSFSELLPPAMSATAPSSVIMGDFTT